MASVVYPSAVLANLRRWGELANQIGLGASFVAAVREMDRRLTHDPEAWGDPLWNYPYLRLTFYSRCGPVLMVNYTVHINGTPVFVRDVRLTPGSALEQADGSSSP